MKLRVRVLLRPKAQEAALRTGRQADEPYAVRTAGIASGRVEDLVRAQHVAMSEVPPAGTPRATREARVGERGVGSDAVARWRVLSGGQSIAGHHCIRAAVALDDRRVTAARRAAATRRRRPCVSIGAAAGRTDHVRVEADASAAAKTEAHHDERARQLHTNLES